MKLFNKKKGYVPAKGNLIKFYKKDRDTFMERIGDISFTLTGLYAGEVAVYGYKNIIEKSENLKQRSVDVSLTQSFIDETTYMMKKIEVEIIEGLSEVCESVLNILDFNQLYHENFLLWDFVKFFMNKYAPEWYENTRNKNVGVYSQEEMINVEINDVNYPFAPAWYMEEICGIITEHMIECKQKMNKHSGKNQQTVMKECFNEFQKEFLKKKGIDTPVSL